MFLDNLASFAFFAAAVAACVFVKDAAQRTQALGVLAVAVGGFMAWRREIPYGIRGREPSGYIVGKEAIAIGAVIAAIGVWAILDPSVFMSLASRGR